MTRSIWCFQIARSFDDLAVCVVFVIFYLRRLLESLSPQRRMPTDYTMKKTLFPTLPDQYKHDHTMISSIPPSFDFSTTFKAYLSRCLRSVSTVKLKKKVIIVTYPILNLRFTRHSYTVSQDSVSFVGEIYLPYFFRPFRWLGFAYMDRSTLPQSHNCQFNFYL